MLDAYKIRRRTLCPAGEACGLSLFGVAIQSMKLC